MGFLIALVATPLLLVVSALCSPEWPQREQVLAELKSKVSLDVPQGPLVFALIPFGIFIGIPAALGLVEPSNILTVLGALVACMIAHGYLANARGTDSPWNAGQGWFVVLAWAVLAFPLYAGSFDVADALAVQAVLGPAPLSSGAASAVLWVALIAGIAAAAGWTDGLPSFGVNSYSRSKAAVDVAARWGETALAATAVSAITWGPSLGVLALGPVGATDVYRAGGSFLVTCGVVAAASYSRRFLVQVPALAAAATVGMFTGGAMLAAAFIR
ncbi:MAG: hypothetical protein ACT4OM_04805 [Actinomycetota bacterium]